MIYGERIRLRKHERDDLEKFVEWFNNPEVRRGISLYLPLSLDEEESWYEAMLKRPSEEQPLAIEIKESGTWKMIGNCGLFGFNWRVRFAEFGIGIGDTSYWNQGYGTEARPLKSLRRREGRDH